MEQSWMKYQEKDDDVDDDNKRSGRLSNLSSSVNPYLTCATNQNCFQSDGFSNFLRFVSTFTKNFPQRKKKSLFFITYFIYIENVTLRMT